MRAPRKLYRVSEIVRHTGVSRQTLHNYTQMGLITEEERTPAGHRLYPESVFGRLARIDRLKKHKTLKQVRQLLEAEATKGSRKK